jgi:hypothetical protein
MGARGCLQILRRTHASPGLGGARRGGARRPRAHPQHPELGGGLLALGGAAQQVVLAPVAVEAERLLPRAPDAPRQHGEVGVELPYNEYVTARVYRV